LQKRLPVTCCNGANPISQPRASECNAVTTWCTAMRRQYNPAQRSCKLQHGSNAAARADGLQCGWNAV
jgi:hypothetical protein